MNLTRRAWLGSAGTLPLAAALGPRASAAPVPHVPSYELPAKAEFAPMDVTYLNAGATHPMSLGSAEAVRAYVAGKTLDRAAAPFRVDRNDVLARFARLIGADPREVCFVPSTTTAENLVVASLGLPRDGSRIVTDALHFYLSFHQHAQLRRQGVDVVTLRLNDRHTVDLDAFAQALKTPTTLVIVSHVSTFNGHVHDLKALCDLAHERGALVYADLAHSAGSVPVDVKACGVDFAACCTYKFLMGDMGAAFLYVRASLMDRLRRPWFGHRQVAHLETHVYPYDTPGTDVADVTLRDDATGFFEVGFPPSPVLAQLSYSLDWLEHVGIARIQAWRQPLVDRLQEKVRGLGFEPLTPSGTASPNVAFAYRDAARLNPKLDAAKIRLTVSPHRIRASVTVFNDRDDIDRLVDALA